MFRSFAAAGDPEATLRLIEGNAAADGKVLEHLAGLERPLAEDTGGLHHRCPGRWRTRVLPDDENGCNRGDNQQNHDHKRGPSARIRPR